MSRLSSQPPNAELGMRGEAETQMLSPKFARASEQDVPEGMEMS